MKPCKFKIVSFQRKDDKEKNYIRENLENNKFVYDEENAELVISLGGDGTFLSSMRKSDFKGNFLSINSGHLGFFADYNHKEIDSFLNDVINKEPIIEKIKLLQMKDKKTDEIYDFFADVVINSIKTVDISLSIDNRHIVSSKANGIVLSSSIGSTGYNFSLNSPISFISSKIMIYSLIAPVRNKMNSNVISKGIVSIDDTFTLSCRGDIFVSIDGQIKRINNKLEIEVTKADREVSLLHFKNVDNISRIKKSI